jgi:poly-gamma-glutamate synthesis protein (capsule biosynthesis protein)
MTAFLEPFVASLLMTAPDGPFAAPAGPHDTVPRAETPGARVAAAAAAEARRPGQVRLAIVGDIMLDGRPGEVVARGEDPFARVAERLRAMDLVVGNLECVIATTGAPEDKNYTFRAHPRVLPRLADYFDAVSVANNHSGDFGKGAFVEGLEWLERSGVGHFGGGRDLESAHRPLVMERGGLRIALLGYSEYQPRHFAAGRHTPGVAWSAGRERRVLADIAGARAVYHADVVIPLMHWGDEDEPGPNDRQRWLARAMIDAGASAVVGAHPHVTQGVETYAGRPIVYSLDNFVFDEYDGRPGWVLSLTLDRSGVVAWEPVVIRTDADGLPSVDPDATPRS